MTDILTQFQHCKLVLINAFGAAVEIWARRMLLSRLDPGCRHGVRYIEMVEVSNSLAHSLFNSCGISSSLPSFLKAVQAASLLSFCKVPVSKRRWYEKYCQCLF